MLSLPDRKLAENLAYKNAVIIKSAQGDAYPAYAYGDRRKRPLRWISRESFQQLTSFGGLQSTDQGYRVSESFARRLKSGGAHSAQHRDMEERELYVPSGVKRSVRRNIGMSAFERLCGRTDKEGEPLLSASLQEAGKMLAQDFAHAGYAKVKTQNYQSAGEDWRSYNGGEEDNHIRRIDAGKRLSAAKAAMGEGLDKAVLAVCCHDQRLEQIERAEQWAAGSGLTLLRMGLTRLAKHYGTQAGYEN
ncbi:DUF6456 domain-containing protein [Hellea balneolensis]|uniref:DUF6456 domain-containing protein n=1 Tax=Hellea balneolensis TaxID=287478 RepID=UPI00040F250C|nr:DUF6456 domain-containing protein [Hellea balneolensis]